MEILRGYDRWKTGEPASRNRPIGECASCTDLVFVGDEIIELDTGEIIHDDYNCVMYYLHRCLGAIHREAEEDDVA